MAHFWDFTVFSGWIWQLWDVGNSGMLATVELGAPSHGTRWCISLLWLARDTERKTHIPRSRAFWHVLWAAVWKRQTCRSLSLQPTYQMHLTPKHITKKMMHYKTKGTLKNNTSPHKCTSVRGELNRCTLNYSSHLQNKFNPTLIVCIFPSAKVQRETLEGKIVHPMGY